jgi:hypothetical protein
MAALIRKHEVNEFRMNLPKIICISEPDADPDKVRVLVSETCARCDMAMEHLQRAAAIYDEAETELDKLIHVALKGSKYEIKPPMTLNEISADVTNGLAVSPYVEGNNEAQVTNFDGDAENTCTCKMFQDKGTCWHMPGYKP